MFGFLLSFSACCWVLILLHVLVFICFVYHFALHYHSFVIVVYSFITFCLIQTNPWNAVKKYKFSLRVRWSEDCSRQSQSGWFQFMVSVVCSSPAGHLIFVLASHLTVIVPFLHCRMAGCQLSVRQMGNYKLYLQLLSKSWLLNNSYFKPTYSLSNSNIVISSKNTLLSSTPVCCLPCSLKWE